MEQLAEALLKEPGGSHVSLFAVAKDITAKEEYDIEKKSTYFYKVLGATHPMPDTKKLHEQSFQRTSITMEECLTFIVASRMTRQSTLVPCIKIPHRIATTLHTERRLSLM